MPKQIEWTPQARADVRRIDRETALRLLEDLADFAINGYGDVERLTDVEPLELRLRLGTSASASTILVKSFKFSECSTAEKRTAAKNTCGPLARLGSRTGRAT